MEESDKIWIEVRVERPYTEGDKSEMRDKIIKAIDDIDLVKTVSKYDYFGEGENIWSCKNEK